MFLYSVGNESLKMIMVVRNMHVPKWGEENMVDRSLGLKDSVRPIPHAIV